MSSTPHDALFKAVFGQPEHARGVLRSIVPPALAERLDWQTLTLRPGSFVDAALTHQHADLLYSARLRDGTSALLYFLFEHQSAPPSEGLMALRLLRYQERIWGRWQADHPRSRTLPVILPIVLYHGAALWSEPCSFEALFEMPAELRLAIEDHLVRFSYLLHDLSEVPDEELRLGAGTALARLAALCFKHARSGADMAEQLRRWMLVVREVSSAPHGLEALAQVLRYILEVSEKAEPSVLADLFEREIGIQAKETVVTVAQQLREVGRQQGMEEGRQQGMEEGVEVGRQQGIEAGRQQGMEAVLLRQLRQRFGAEVDPRVEQVVATASSAQLEVWAVRVLSAATLAELFAS